jgi:ABC-type amino acid transport substrate-binding protein
VSETIRVGFYKDFYPFSFQKDGEAQGMFVDIACRAFAKAGFSITWIPVSHRSAQSDLESRALDAVCGMAITQERSTRVHFSMEVIATGGALFFPRDRPHSGGDSSVAPESVATPASGPLADAVVEYFPEATLVLSQDYYSCFMAVIEQKVDAAALNYHVGCFQARRDFAGQILIPDSIFNPLSLAVGFGEHVSSDVVERFNDEVTHLKASGQLEVIRSSY